MGTYLDWRFRYDRGSGYLPGEEAHGDNGELFECIPDEQSNRNWCSVDVYVDGRWCKNFETEGDYFVDGEVGAMHRAKQFCEKY